MRELADCANVVSRERVGGVSDQVLSEQQSGNEAMSDADTSAKEWPSQRAFGIGLHEKDHFEYD